MTPAAPRTASMHTRGGIRLDADVYRPNGNGPFPVLLMRQPYGRALASTIAYAHPTWYAARGYIVVIQDVRGRGTSEGEFRLFADDIADGADTVNWAASLPGSSGAVGMYGFSYQGTNQLLAAAAAGPALKALAPAMIGWDMGRDWAYENDAFCLAAGLGWATQMAAENARLTGDREAFDTLYRASRALPFGEPVAARPGYMMKHAKYGHYRDWLDHPPDHAYWRAIAPAALAKDSRLPMLFVGGWYDSHLPGTLAAYRHFAARDPARTRLIVGPWLHFPWARRVGGHDFGAEAAGNIDELQIRWFDHWLKGGPSPEAAPVRLFDLGAGHWRDFAAWPSAHRDLFLAGSGRSALDDGDGRLLARAPESAPTDYIVHDPWRPVPAVGGAYGTPPGPADRAAIDARPDVLTYTTEPAGEPWTIAGDVAARLRLVADAPSFDISCVLSLVSASGRAMPVAQGYRRVISGADLTSPVEIPLRATCVTIRPGERLRLSIAGACFPAYPVNPGTGADPTASSIFDARIITIGVAAGSRLQLGVVPSS